MIVPTGDDPIAQVTPRAGGGGGNAAALGTIVAGAVLVVAAIGVRGDFPLSDDWSYAYSSRALCTEGVLRFLPWTGASLVLQSWYGAALCRIFGFSFEILRASTLLLAGLGAVGFHLLLGHAGVEGRARALATALFALNPLYVNLAFTFMTDVPFTVIAVWAGYAYVRGFASGQRSWLLAGSLGAAAALLIRQHGLFVAAAAALTALGTRDRAWQERVLDVLAATALPFLASVGFHVWLFAWHGSPSGVGSKLTEAARPALLGTVNNVFRGLETMGLLLAPLAVAVRRDLVTRHPRLVATACTVLAILALLLYLREGAAMFYLTNVMFDLGLGLGASTLRDTQFLALRPPIQLGPPLSAVLTLVATLAAGILLGTWASPGAHPARPQQRFLTSATLMLFLATLLHTRYYFDRYLLVVVPFAIAATCVAAQVHVARASLLLTAVLAFYAVAGTHDYLAWNRARYAALATLADAGISPEAIDGGLEFNAWHLAAKLGTFPTDAEARPGQPDTTKSWWWVVDDRFVASFRPLPGYTVRQAVPYRRWLAPGTGRIFILEREPLTAQ